MFLPALLALALVAQGTSSATTEMLGIDAPDQFRIGNHQRDGKVEIVELVEPPETVDNWSKLVTNMMFFDAAQFGLERFDDQWLGSLRSGCPGMTDTVERGRVDGHLAIRHTLSCPRNPQTGKLENLSAVVVQGDANLMMAQVAFRHSLTASDVALVEHIVGSLRVCDQRSLDSCRARKATGFEAAP